MRLPGWWFPGQPLAMPAYGVAIFLGAFLLFQVQPLIGKYVLPWFGGAPSVWTTCMLFFQVLLVAGYGYAHLSSRWLKPRAQVFVHLALVALGIMTLPIVPNASWRPSGDENPTLRILGLLAANVGLPYFALSATGPLLQTWFARRFPGRAPYRLYALSNLASLLALLSFPTVFETSLPRAVQSTVWAVGLGVYFLSCIWVGAGFWSANSAHWDPVRDASAADAERSSGSTRLLWLLLPFCASALLLAITNKICQDVAVIAFLWVVPLAIYLLSFIICFDRPGWYRRSWFGALLLASVVTMALMIAERVAFSVPAQIAIYAVGLFACCMVCHGEVYRLKPHPAYLTSFYLLIAAGGALGGVFVALVAPLVFSDFFELHLGLLLATALFLGLWFKGGSKVASRVALVGSAAGALVWVLAGTLLWQGATRDSQACIWRQRNFYGVLAVCRHEFPDPLSNQVEMMHGRIAHGMQYLHETRLSQATLYYSQNSGVGRAFVAMETNVGRCVGVVGLGAGTLATYGKPGDRIRFYEINPEVEKAARRHFSFLLNSLAQVQVVLGDARLSLEREPAQAFDLLVLDAFSGDAIPVHLLTREAFEIYRRHLKPGGTLAAHISNMSLDLEPLMVRQAYDGGWRPLVIKQPHADYQNGVLPSTWVLMSQDPGLTQRLHAPDPGKTGPQLALNGRAWTDDFSPVFPLLRLCRGKSATSSSLAQGESPASAAEWLASLRQDLSRDPGSITAMNNLAVLLATAADPKLRNGAEAVRLAEKASEISSNENPVILSTLAAAYAESGRFPDAIRTSEKAIELARAAGADAVVKRNAELLEYYRRGEAYHQQDKPRQ